MKPETQNPVPCVPLVTVPKEVLKDLLRMYYVAKREVIGGQSENLHRDYTNLIRMVSSLSRNYIGEEFEFDDDLMWIWERGLL